MMDFKPGFSSIAGRCFGVNTWCAISVMSQVCRLWVLIATFLFLRKLELAVTKNFSWQFVRFQLEVFSYLVAETKD
jgi:hypothetical protein